jgi:hypothetical protein
MLSSQASLIVLWIHWPLCKRFIACLVSYIDAVAPAALGGDAVDVLVRVLDVTGLEVDAVLPDCQKATY